MRINRIRITSLASLHGAQPVVDFAGPILGSAGLVAITGPTGSGKSTLLDGLSLAIFGCTPRLGKDTDHLLSRDAVDGGAEATFTLDDGSQWIASWHAHRSRRQLDGAVQAPAHQIARAADGGLAASGIKEVKAWVEQHLRLTFEQFRGVMLLAQFDFARFLIADDKDRSLLLEKLTGTDLYAKLSTAAFERCKAAQEQVQQHQLVLAGLTLLTADERAAVEAAITAGAETSSAAEASWAAAQATVAWWSERQRLQDEQTQRQVAAADADRSWQDAEAERQRLAAAEAALQVQGELARVDEARLQATRTLQTLGERHAASTRSLAALRQQEQDLAQSVARLGAATAAAEAAAQAVAGLARMPDAALQPAREAGVQERERSLQLSELRRVGERKRGDALAAASAAAAAASALHSAVEQRNLAGATLAAAESERAAILAGGDAAALGEQAALAREAGSVARALAQLDLAGATAALAQAESQVAAAQAQALQMDQALSLAISQVGLAETQKQGAESLAHVAAFSHLLQPGQPCPLCGSSEHPHPAVAGSTLVAEAHLRLVQATQQRTPAEAAAQQAATAVAMARAALAMQTATVERVTTALSQGSTRWRALVGSLPALPAQPDVATTDLLAQALIERLAAARRSEAAFATAQTAQRTAELALADSERRLALALAGQQQADQDVVDSIASVTATETSLAAAQAAFSTAVAACAQQLGEAIPTSAPTWLEALPARLAAARACAEQARMLREGDQELGNQGRSRLPAGSVPELPPAAVADPHQLITALRRVVEMHQAALAALAQAEQAQGMAQEAVDSAARTVGERQALLQARVATTTFADEATLRLALLPQPELHTLRQHLQQLQQAAVATKGEGERAALALAGHGVPPGLDAADPSGATLADAALAQAQASRDALRDQLLRDRQSLADDDQRQRQRARIEAEAGPLLAAAERSATLSELIGSRDGARFRRFAQALTLDQLVVLANHRLASLAPRYKLTRTHAVIGQDPSLGLEIIDQEQADAQRPVATLSGGETFLVSLALALALADLKRGGLHLGTLFIDEGFGSLDPATLERCLAILERLQQEQGTQIVVISHVGALHERLAHRIEVRPQGNGRSRLVISGPEGTEEATPADPPPAPVVSFAVDPEALLAALPDDGRPLSSSSLRKLLGWEPATFKAVVESLMDAGHIEQPPGARSLRRRIG